MIEKHSEFLLREIDPHDLIIVEQKIDEILSKVTATDEYGIELQIHDLILKNVRYVNTGFNCDHTIEGVLLNKKAVCEGIAKTTKILLNRKSIKCELVTGRIKGNESLHAWNIVCIEGKWYHLDVTADLTIMHNDTYRYDYFNLSDEEISKDHDIINSIEKCTTSKNSYYYRSGMVISTQKEFIKIFSRRLLFRKKEIIVKLPSTSNVNDVCGKIFDSVEKSMKMSPWPYRGAKIYYNIDQLVFHIIVS